MGISLRYSEHVYSQFLLCDSCSQLKYDNFYPIITNLFIKTLHDIKINSIFYSEENLKLYLH